MKSTTGKVARASVALALLFVAFGIGGSLFEHLTVDRVWPENVRIIQPEHGGIDRKVYWIPIHSAITLALLVAVVATWKVKPVRRMVLLAIGAYAAMRIWTAFYFIPNALEFEKIPEMTPEALQRARTWILWSVVRSLLLVASGVALWRAMLRQRAGEA